MAVPLAVVRRAAALLRPGGVLVMEHDSGQGAALRGAALAVGFGQAVTGADLTGRDQFQVFGVILTVDPTFKTTRLKRNILMEAKSNTMLRKFISHSTRAPRPGTPKTVL